MSNWLSRLWHLLTNGFEPVPSPEPDPEPSPPPNPTPTPPDPPAPGPPSIEASVLEALNSARASRHLPPLVEDPRLARLASSWASSMAAWGVLDHGDFADRIASIDPNTAAAEDIAEGQPDAASVVAAWMNDPPHRANILGDYNRAGVGFGHDEEGSIYWCVDFARID